MSSKRKAPSPVKQDTKRVRSTGSRTRSVNQQKEQDGRGATRAAPAMNKATMEQITQQVVQGPSVSSSAQPEVLYNRTLSNMYNELEDYQKNKERRIILIGKTGAGKSTLANAILGDKCFENEGLQMHSTTKCCQLGEKKMENGKNIVVVDTPGLNDTQQEDWKVIEELIKCTAMTAPGPHAFCLVIRGDERFTKESIDTLDEFCDFFGEEIYKYLIVVFTHKSSMGKGASTDDCLSALPAEFATKFLKSGGKKIAIECTAEKKALKKQINELFKLIEDIIKKNYDGYYSEEKFKAAEQAFRKRIPKIQQEVKKLLEGKKKTLEDEYQEKAKRLEERANILAMNLQEEKDKLMHEKQLKENEKLEKDVFEAHMRTLKAKYQEKKKSLKEQLEKERKEKEKTKEDFDRKMEEIKKKEERDLGTAIREERREAREAVPQSKGFGNVARNAVKEGAGLVFNVVASGLRTTIGAIGRIGICLRR